MKKLFCEYCGELLSDKCDCNRELELARLDFIEALEESPESQLGYQYQDMIDSYRMER